MKADGVAGLLLWAMSVLVLTGVHAVSAQQTPSQPSLAALARTSGGDLKSQREALITALLTRFQAIVDYESIDDPRKVADSLELTLQVQRIEKEDSTQHCATNPGNPRDFIRVEKYGTYSTPAGSWIESALSRLVSVGGTRVHAVPLTGNTQVDTAALRAAAGGGADMAFDMLGQATEANATLAALGALRRGGRLVLMGSMTVPLPISYSQVMASNLEIIGQFMYPADACLRLLDLVRTGLLDIGAIVPKTFSLADLPQAIEACGSVTNLESIVVRP